jgi:5'-nucleotidase
LPAGLVDVVIGDHTNIQFSATAPNGVLYHENASFGNTYARTLITATPGKDGTVSDKSVSFVTPGPTGSLTAGNTSCGTLTYCDQAIVDMLVPYRAALAAALDGKIGTTTLPFDRGGNIERRQEMPIGDLVADGMRLTYGVDFGYITGGSLRTQFPACSYAPVDTTLHRSNYDSTHTNIVPCSGGYAVGGPYDLVKGDVYAVLPFGNNVITRDVTGHLLWQMLENGVSLCPNPITSTSTCQGRFPQVSGLKVTYKLANPSGCTGSETSTPPTWACQTGTTYRTQTVTRSDGTPIADDNALYTLATTDFTNTGGDAYFMLKDGQGVTRDRDANVFLSYMEVVGPDLDPTRFPLDRVTFVP